MAYSFTATVASRDYHVCKSTSWTKAKWEKKLQLRWKQKNSHWKSIHMREPLKLKTVRFFIKIEGDKIIGYVKSLTYRPSSIPSGGLEIPLQLTFTCDDKLTLDLMNGFCEKPL